MKLVFLFLAFSISAHLQNIKINAKSAILINVDTGNILYEKHADIPMYPASITKVATALFVLDQKDVALDSKMTVSTDALKIKPLQPNGSEPAYWGEVDGTKMWLVSGEKVPLESLLHGLIRNSGNDAANVIAENLSSSIPSFVSEMNAYVRTLGCKNTQFKNPHGIHHKEHFTTAYDMSIIFKKALQISKFREVTSSAPYNRPKTNRQPGSDLSYKDPLLIPGKYFYPKIFSVKKGFHSDAKHTIVAAAKNQDRTLAVVLMGCETSADRCKDTIALFENAFNETKETKVLFRAFCPVSVSIGMETIKATLLSDLTITYFPSEEPECKALVRVFDTKLPIRKGQKIAELQIHDTNGNILETKELVSMEDVKPTLFKRLKSLLGTFF